MRDKAAVAKVIREALAAVREGEVEADPASDELGLDSTQSMQLIMEIEERLDISIPVEALADARTVDQLCAGIMQLDS